MINECRNCKYWKATYDADCGMCYKKNNHCFGWDTCMSFCFSPEDEKLIHEILQEHLKHRNEIYRIWKQDGKLCGGFFKPGDKYPGYDEKKSQEVAEIFKKIDQRNKGANDDKEKRASIEA